MNHNSGFRRVKPNGVWRERSAPALSLSVAVRLFDYLDCKTIFELGSGLQGEMSGNSCLHWIQTGASSILCCDLEQQRLDSIFDHLSSHQPASLPRFTFLNLDGIQWLEESNLSIDLLYLDFWAPDPPQSVFGTGRENAYASAYESSRANLADESIVLIDDTDHVPPWKHTKVISIARSDGFVPIWTGRQTCLVRSNRMEQINKFLDTCIAELI